jgi:NitT/TauT family transport system substrate-binding protein
MPNMKKLVLETTAPFQGLPELVAFDEGFFKDEGIEVSWANRNKGDPTEARTDVLSQKGLDPFVSHGKLFEQGQADMYNACEWGNYCRVQDSKNGSRQVGRRAIVTYAAIVVRGDSPVYTPQQLADRTVGVPFYFGTHYLALHLLEGFMPRERIKLCSVSNNSVARYKSLMDGVVDATTLTEPYLSLAEKEGCRAICGAFYHGTEVASDKVDAETYAAFNRAVKRAVVRINADKQRYLQYFIDHHKKEHPGIAGLTTSDLRASRIMVCDPAPIPDDELQRTFEWLRSWDMLEKTDSPTELVDMGIQVRAHAPELRAS